MRKLASALHCIIKICITLHTYENKLYIWHNMTL